MRIWRRICYVMLIFATVLSLAACGDGASSDRNNDGSGEAVSKPVTIRFSEVIRSIFYAPYYVAMSEGFFEEEGIILDMNTAQGSDKGAAALIAGIADISLIGPETAIYIYNQHGDKRLIIFYQLTMKDGSFLMSREPVEAFQWSSVADKTILGWRPGSAPQMVLQSTLAKEDVHAQVVTNIAAPALPGAFTSGQGDFIQLFEPVALTLEQEGTAYFAASMGEAFGTFPETSFVATSMFIEQNPEIIQRFVVAVDKGQAWLKTASDEEIVDSLLPYFEGTSKDLILQAVKRYQEQDTWPDHPELTPDAFEILQTVLIDNGVLKPAEKIQDMKEIVDMRFVNKLEE